MLHASMTNTLFHANDDESERGTVYLVNNLVDGNGNYLVDENGYYLVARSASTAPIIHAKQTDVLLHGVKE